MLEIKNLLALLVHNERVMLLPDISLLFEVLRAEQEKILEARVISFSPLSAVQQEQLTHALSQRLQRQITLKIR